MKFLLSFLLLIPAALAADAAASSRPPLTLGEALVRVEAGHPWFRTRESLAALAQARHEAAAARPPGELSLQLENALGTGELRAGRGAETTLQFSRALDWADRRSARMEAAATLGEADRLAWAETRRGLLAETARRFIRVVAAQVEFAAARENIGLLRLALDNFRMRAARAAGATAEVARAQLALSEAQLEAGHAEHLLLAARQSLASLWGADAPDFDHAEADFATLPESAGYEALATRLADVPAQKRFAALARWHQAQEKLAHTTGTRGDPRWSAGLRRVEAGDDFGFVAGLSYAWPTMSAAGAQAAEARSERDRTEAEGAAALLEARAALYALCQELDHARTEHNAARDEMIPAAQAWLDSIEQAPAGRYGLRELLEARSALFAAGRRQTAAAAAYHSTLVAIEQMLGGGANP